jgi:beta-aspartyl-peptidase (threonine type)
MNTKEKLRFVHFKPYVYILLFISIPVIFFQLFKNKSQPNYPDPLTKVEKQPFGLVIHGGAGHIVKDLFTPEAEETYKKNLRIALEEGNRRLVEGDSAIYVVEAVINILEDCPLFNAGKGAVFTHNGNNELDASIMDGSTMNAGAVAGVSTVKNPISLAIKVMNNSKHVLLSGKGAEAFAIEQKIDTVPPGYFYTQRSFKSLQKALEKEKHGTVGCVVLDKYGNIVAGTSTGGMTNKKYGRIGDSPIIGAGTYANSNICGISCTGHGEFFIRYSVAHEIASRMKYLDEPISTAANSVINELSGVNGYGGVIGLDKNGNVAMEFNTKGMFRGFYMNNDTLNVKLFAQP